MSHSRLRIGSAEADASRMQLAERSVRPSATPPTDRSTVGLDRVWVAIAISLPVLIALAVRMGAVDLTYHLRVGELILRAGVPRSDTFTFGGTGRAWLDQQWGAQVALWTAFRSGGWAGLVLLRAIAAGATFGFVYLACRTRGATVRASALLTTGSFFLGITNLAMRPQILAFPLFTASLWIVIGRDKYPRRLWLLPILTLVWANVHGSFVLAPAMLVLAAIEDRITGGPRTKHLWTVLSLVIGATLIGPLGTDVWRYALLISTSATIRNEITEWQPTTVAKLGGATFFGSAVLIAGFLARRRDPVPWPALLWLGCFFLLGLPAFRGMVWWGFVAPVILAGLLPTMRSASPRRGSAPLNACFLAVVVAATALLLPRSFSHDPRVGADRFLMAAPQSQISALARTLPAGSRLFVSQPSASWVEFALPSMPVFVDSRIELFSEPVWDDYFSVVHGEVGYDEILDRWGIDAVLTDIHTERLRDILLRDPQWALLLRDEQAAVFIRR
jgi:hypothetical protein